MLYEPAICLTVSDPVRENELKSLGESDLRIQWCLKLMMNVMPYKVKCDGIMLDQGQSLNSWLL